MKKSFLALVLLAVTAMTAVRAQETLPDWMRWHYLSEEEMNTPVRAINFTETPPPAGEPRFVAEFEPMQGVMIRYPLGIPENLVALLSNNCRVYCITQQQNSAQNTFQNAGVNMSNVTFINAPTDSYWVRDYGPWYIFEDRQPAIVDNVYNRPRPNDDNVSQVFANYWDIPMYGMNLEHTGGNMMEDGRGHGVSDDLVVSENGNNEENVRQKMRNYLGIDPYHITIDPQGDYIAHVDCWGKYLAPDKILIAQLPQNNPRYQYYEQVAEYFATTNCCWGYPYHVYRVQEPGGNTLAPYTNSLILNKTVYVPLGNNNNYNQQALQVYQDAMPGYEIVGVPYNSFYGGWQNTDALHCRTRGVMDFHMLFVDHREVLHGEQAWQESYPVVSKFIAYSGAELKQDSLLVYYRVDQGAYQVAHMTPTGNPDEYVGYITGYHGGSQIDYYVFGADESGHRYTQPVFADLDPHHFTVGAHSPSGELVIAPDTLWFSAMGQERTFTLTNETDEMVRIEDIVPEDGSELTVSEPGTPFNLQVGESATVTVNLIMPPLVKDDYQAYKIQVLTSMGQYQVTVMVLDEAYDMGLYIPGSPIVELTVDEPQTVVYVTNGNYGTQTPIQITSVYEVQNPAGTPYLVIQPEHATPYTVSVGEDFRFSLAPNVQDGKGQVTTFVFVESNDRRLEFMVSIDENLLTSVTEVSDKTRLYPNPTTDMFVVEGARIAAVEVYNLVGQKVYASPSSASNALFNIDATRWNKGIYLVNIINRDGSVETKKLVLN